MGLEFTEGDPPAMEINLDTSFGWKVGTNVPGRCMLRYNLCLGIGLGVLGLRDYERVDLCCGLSG